MNLLRKIGALFRKNQLDRDMAEEMRFHLEQRAEENVADGLSSKEARYAAQRKFGGVDQIKEHCREQRRSGFLWLEQAGQDLGYAARTLAKSPRQTAIAALTLALGIGLVTIQFSVVDGIRSGLPFEGADRIVWVFPLDQRGRVAETPITNFFSWRETQRSFERLAAGVTSSLEVGGENLTTRTYRGAAFSAGVLELLGVQPIVGRSFTTEDERTDAPPVLLLGHRVWQNDFGGDPAIVGRSVRLRGEPATVIGVLPDEFGFPENEQVWVNLRPTARLDANRPGARASVRLLGRLREETTPESAQAEFDLLVRQSDLAGSTTTGAHSRARIRPVVDPDGGRAGVVALALLGVVGGVLALACLNVANLLSARALHRGPELALRSAIGATRGRLLRQLLTESLLLSLLGAAGGIALAAWGVPLVDRQFAELPDKPFWFVVELDRGVLVFSIVLTAAVGVLSGLFPALRATRQNANDVLKDTAGGGGSGVRLGRINRGLVIVQLALSSALLIVTSVLVHAAWSGGQIGLPFQADTVLSAQLRLSTREFREPEARSRFYDDLLQRLRSSPGVTNATLSDRYPVERTGEYLLIEPEGRENGRAEFGPTVYDSVADGFFRDLQIPLREGREFTVNDTPQSERVAIVNESFARMTWPGDSAVGKRFRRVDPNGELQPWLTVVGVVADLASDRTPRASAVYHMPLRQTLPSQVLVYLRGVGDASLPLRPLRDAVDELSRDVPVDRVMTLAARMQERIGPVRVFSFLSLAFGASGLFLAAVGVYGVTAFTVQRRTREFGIRLALGARPADLLRFVFQQGARQLALGLSVGALLGWAGARPLGQALNSLTGPLGPIVYLVVLGLIAATMALALWIPARAAARVNPMTALRAE